jgi:O-antigen ligase
MREAVLMSRADSQVETLTGRTALWNTLLGYWADRPVLGYGLGGFWSARHVEEIYRAQRWPVSEAHSTYVDVLLDSGVVGLALYLLVLATALRSATRRDASHADASHGFMVSLLVYFLVVGAIETMQPNPSFLTFLFFWSLALLGFRDATTRPRSPCAST